MEFGSQVVLPAATTPALPQLDVGAIALAVATKTVDADILAQLLFLPGQYLLVTKEDRATNYKFVSPAALKAAFANEPVDSGWLTSNTVRWGDCHQGEWLVQFYPPRRYQLALERFTADAPISTPLPGFVFVGCDLKYWIWAVKSNSFDPNLALFHAPLPNVMSDGSICFGDNSPPSVRRWGLYERGTCFGAVLLTTTSCMVNPKHTVEMSDWGCERCTAKALGNIHCEI
jgi:hypothetical protein